MVLSRRNLIFLGQKYLKFNAITSRSFALHPETFLQVYLKGSLQIRNMSSSKAGLAPTTVAVCQMRSTNDKAHNLQQVEELIKMAKSKNAQFVFLPECCDYVGTNRAETFQLAEEFSTGPTMAAYQKLARDNSLWLSLGGLHEITKNGDGERAEKISNSHVMINSCGEIVTIYRKLHMFDVNTPEFKFRESDAVEGGTRIVAPIDTPVGKIGLQICYDLRFPEVATILRKCGAEIITYPSAFAYSTGEAHWHILLRARAIENQCYVLAAAQIGNHNKKRRSYGHALIVDPWGKILGESSDDKELDVIVADISPTVLSTVRQNMPCFAHRRHDVYALTSLELQCSLNEYVEKPFNFGGHDIPLKTIFCLTEHSFAFTNIRCVVKGHVLVATKRPIARLNELRPEEITDFFHTVCKIQRMCEHIHKSTASSVTVQDGQDAGQTVKHVHCHVMPRRVGDFKQNDEIYTELNRHDKDEALQRRDISEMIAEAEIYRKALVNFDTFPNC